MERVEIDSFHGTVRVRGACTVATNHRRGDAPDVSDADRSARELAASQYGVVSRHQLRDIGIGRQQIRNLLGPHGRWVELTDEVLRLAGTAPSTAQQVAAAVFDAGPGAVLSHLSAANWWGLSGCPALPVHVTRTSSTTRQPNLAAAHRVRRLPDRWVTCHRGLPVVRPELLALHLYAACRPARAERLVDRLWSMRLLSGSSLGAFLAEVPRSGTNGAAGLRRYHAERGETYRPPDSGLESRFQQIARAAGIPFRRQVDVGDDANWTGRVDFCHEWLPLVVEVQSEAYHSSLVDQRADAARTERLLDEGFTVVEVTDTLVWTAPDSLRDRLWAAVRAAGG